MDKIRDSADILQPEKEETYQFIEKLLSSVKENFSTNRVHLGMDGTWKLSKRKWI